MARRPRPANAMFIAICNILLGLPCLCCSGFGTGSEIVDMANGNQPAPAAEDDDDKDAPPPAANPNANANPNDPFGQFGRQMEAQANFLEKELPQHGKIMLALNALTLVASLMLLVSGVLLLLGRPTGRVLCILAAVVLIGSSAAEAIYDLTVVRPVAQKFDQKNERAVQAKGKPAEPFGMDTSLLINAGVMALFGIGYPLLAIAVMFVPNVRQYYASAGAAIDEHDRYQDEDDIDRPRRRDDEFE